MQPGKHWSEQANTASKRLRVSAAADPLEAYLPMNISIMDNNISKVDYDLFKEIPIDMLESDNTAYRNDCRTYQERNAKLEKHRGRASSLILVHCKQLLQ